MVCQGCARHQDDDAADDAAQAGMKHFCIEQDNAADWGDSVAAARVSYQSLLKVLS
ncbi:hypothetical protein SBA3_2070027 [Candidatus Sulfopaludibacter sp. SbA3]|nr:hypothetical protein SBA3_2070027 [Candidatus Sulfopaludibacter sp. SbA3]